VSDEIHAQEILMDRNASSPGLDSIAEKLIRRKAKELIGKAGFSRSDREDIEQELRLHVLQAIPQFDPQAGDWSAFLKTVIERTAAKLWQHSLAEMRHPDRSESLQQLVQGEDGFLTEKANTLLEDAHTRRLGTTARSDHDRVDLVHDVATVLAKLPDDLRNLGERLQHQSVGEIARETGMPRSTLRDALKRLRAVFEEAGLDEYLREK
jgi:RNA polymerase sigma-70 factor (ECF subfamily)